MNMRIISLFCIAVLTVGVSACSKQQNAGGETGQAAPTTMDNGTGQASQATQGTEQGSENAGGETGQATDETGGSTDKSMDNSDDTDNTGDMDNSGDNDNSATDDTDEPSDDQGTDNNEEMDKSGGNN